MCLKSPGNIWALGLWAIFVFFTHLYIFLKPYFSHIESVIDLYILIGKSAPYMFEKASCSTRNVSMIQFLLFKKPAYKEPYLCIHQGSRINTPTVNTGYCLGSWSEKSFHFSLNTRFAFFVTMSMYNFVINYIWGGENATSGFRTTFHPPQLFLNTQPIQPLRQVGQAQCRGPSQTGLCFPYRLEQSGSLSSELM